MTSEPMTSAQKLAHPADDTAVAVVPLVTIYLLAAMQSIPRDLYEAAWTDGAGRFYRFRRITLPMIIDTYKTAIGSYKYGEGAARAVMICIFLSLFCLAYFRVVGKINTGERA